MANQFIYTTALDKIRRMKSRIKVIPGGSSAGKTVAIVSILIDMCIKNKGLSVSIVSETMPHLRRGAMRDFLNVMQSTNRYIDTNWNRTNLIYTFTNQSYIEFFSAEEDSKLKGARRNVLYINEATNISEDAYTQLAMRTDKDIYVDYNPSHRFWADDITGDTEKLILTYKDNESLAQTVIDFLESKRILAETSSYWANWCKVYLEGRQGVLEGAIYNNWGEVDIVPSQATLIGYGLDFGFTNDPTACVAVYKLDDKIVLDEIVYQKGLSNSDISSLLKQENVQGEIYADSSDPKSISELRRYGHRIFPAKKGPDSILYGIGILQEKEMLVTKRSTNLKNELIKYSWKKDKDGTTLNIPIDIYNHGCDSIRYLAMMKLGKVGKTDFGIEVFDF